MLVKFDPRPVDRAIEALARAQHVVFHARQIVPALISQQALSARVSAKRLFRIHHGVYSLVPRELLTPRGLRMAAVLACGPGAALSHHSAAALHGLRRSGATKIDVTVPSRGGRRRAGLAIHRSSTLRARDITTVDDIPCTTIARTILDLAGVLTPRRLERVLDEAVALERFDLIALEEQIRHNRGRRRAARALDRALREHRPGSTQTDGWIGEEMLAIIRAAGLPDPEVQAWVDLGDGEMMIRPDFVWRPAKLILETDGGIHHRGRRIVADKRRDQRAARAGWQTLRATGGQIRGEPARLAETVTAVLRSRWPAA